MKNNNLLIGILVSIFLIIFLYIISFNYPMGYGYGMMGSYFGSFGLMWILGPIIMFLVVVALILFILWIVRELSKENERRPRKR